MARSTGSASRGSIQQACFASLLGTEENGYWQICPTGTVTSVSRRYRENTLVLETDFTTEDGTIRVTDCMPIREGHPEVIRQVEGIKGTVDVSMCMAIRLGYGCTVPWVRLQDGLLIALAGPDGIALWTPVKTWGEDFQTRARFKVSEGQTVPFVLTWYASHEAPPRPTDALFAIAETASMVGGMVVCVHGSRRIPPCCASFTHHVEGPHLPADGRDRRCRHYLVARNARWGAELGLPVLLVARCDSHPHRADARRLPRRSHGLARLALASRSGEHVRASDHVRRRRGAEARRVGGGLAIRLREIRSRYESGTPLPANTSSTSTARSCQRCTSRHESAT